MFCRDFFILIPFRNFRTNGGRGNILFLIVPNIYLHSNLFRLDILLLHFAMVKNLTHNKLFLLLVRR